MMGPGWADAFGKTLSVGTRKEIEQATGKPHGPRFRIDYARRAESASRGGRKGGKRKKGWRKHDD